MPENEFETNYDDGSYNTAREADEFRGNDNNRRVAERRANQGETSAAVDPRVARRQREATADDSVLGGKVAPNGKPTFVGTAGGPSFKSVSPTGEALQGNGGGGGAAPAWPNAVKSN